MISHSRRLKTICDLIPDYSYVADIGADHGELEVLILSNKVGVKVLAIENKEGPYRNLFNSLRAVDGVRLSFSDGLSSVDRDVDTLVLAGMGGMNIIDIFNANVKKLKWINTIITDAHKDAPEVRKYLTKKCFKIEKEMIVYENGKYYVITKYERSVRKVSYPKDTYEFGKNLFKDKLWKEYSECLINECDNIAKNIENSSKNTQALNAIKSKKERIINYGKNEVI